MKVILAYKKVLLTTTFVLLAFLAAACDINKNLHIDMIRLLSHAHQVYVHFALNSATIYHHLINSIYLIQSTLYLTIFSHLPFCIFILALLSLSLHFKRNAFGNNNKVTQDRLYCLITHTKLNQEVIKSFENIP